MKRLKLFFACLLMAVLSIGQVWAATADVTYDFTGSGWTVSSGTLSDGTVSFTGAGSANFKMNGGYFMMGKSGAYINFPTYTSAVSKIVVTGNSGASASTKMNIYVGETAVSTETTGSTGTNIYEIASASQAAGTTYTLKVTSNHNAQITKIEVFYASETPTCATPTFDPEGGEFSSNSIDVEIATTTDGATIYYTTDGTNPTTSSSVYSSALNITETTTVKAMAVKTGANNSAVASATYTKVAPFDGLKLTFDVSSNPGEWPTTNPATTTNYTYTLNSTDYTFALNNVKCNSGYLMLTSVAKLGLPAIEGYKLVKVEATNSSGCSTSTKVKITEDEAGSTVVTGGAEQTWSTTSTKYTYTLSGTEAETMYYLYVSNKNCQIVTLELYYEEVEAPLLPKAAKPTFESGDENFVTSTSVTLACTTVGAKIYYTTNGDEPTTSSTLYEGAIPVSTTTTIKAIAVADGYDKSTTAEKTFTQVEALQSLAALLEATTSTETGYNVVISDWVVTGAISNRAWISNAENTKGILLYKSGHGFTAGKKLNGVVLGTKAKIYQGYPELTSLLASEVTVSDAAEITPRETTLAAIVSGYNVEQGTVVKLENVTYTAGTGFSDGTNTVALNTQLYGPTMVDGATYNIIGVVRYDNGPVYSIMPRSVDDVEQISGGGLPEVDGLAELKEEATGASYLVNLTNAVVTLVSGNNAFIEDATAGALIFYNGHGLVAGDKLNGQYEVTTATYQGKFEITAMEAQTGAEKTSGAEIPETTLTIAQLNANFAANESKRIKIVGANVTDAISGSDRNGSISDGAALAVYAGVASTITLDENDNVDIIGYPGFHNTDEQLTVWAQADITVNSSEPPVVDPRKVAESPEGGFSSVSGNLSGNEISFAAYQGGSATAPNGNNTAHELRLYKYQESTNYGGYVTITAKTGCTIDQVVITVGGNCKVGYCKDAENFPTKEATPINVSTSNPFDTDKGLGASSVNVVNLDGSNQFKIKTITVYYTGEGIDLESIAISGDASVLEYTEGDAFNPAGLSVIGHYSDNSDAEITTGIDWAFDPATLSAGDASVSVTATVGELTSAAVVVNGLTVSAAVAPTPSTDNVVILATHGTKLYAMSTTNSNNAFAAIVVEEDGSNIVVTSEEAKAAIQWTRSSNGITATFQDANSKYLTATNGSTNLSLGEDECVWKWYAGEGKNCYSIENEDETKLRSFLYYSNNGIFKNYALSNAGGNYSGIAEVRVIAAENIVVVAPTTHTLSYNANGGTLMEGKDEIADAQVAENATVTVAANVYEKEGYVFAGWLYGETVYNAGQTFDMPTEDVELVAQWATISTDNVVIIAQSSGQWYAIQAEAGTANHTVKAVPIVYENNTIYLVESKRASITWERKSAGAQASFKNGTNYLTGKTSDSNDLDLGADECWWTFNSTSNIYQTHADHSLLYSESAGVFKNYKSSNAGKTGYSALPIVVPAVFGDPSYEIVRQELVPNAYYTMCLEKAVDAVQGGSIWRVLSKAQNDKDIILEEVTGTLEAGRPYIFFATASELQVVYAGAAVLEEVNDEANNGLIGSFEKVELAQSPNTFIIYNNALYYVNSDNVYVGDHRAYLDMDDVPDYNGGSAAPGRRRVTMTVYGEQVATGMDSVQPSEISVQKVMINGQMFILRGEKMFDATGRLVK